MDKMTLVVAPTPDEYALWCRADGKGRTSQYASCPEMLYGWGRINVVELGQPLWWTQADTDQLAAIKERSRA
jgi:hypothetical protein